MKERILKNWTARRVIYAVMGTAIIVQAIITHEWIGILFGGYFTAMGVFSFGCAAGNCGYTPHRKPYTTTAAQTQDVVYEEIK